MYKLFLYYLILINILGYSLMYIDKRKAIKKRWRISEHNLLLVAILGGSIGSLLGMYTFRHKTKHLKFKIGIPCIIVVQCILLITISNGNLI